VNDSVWKKLSDKDQATVKKLAAKWCTIQRKQTIAQEDDFLNKLKAKGMKVNEIDKAAFQKAVQPIWKEYESVFGKDLIDLVREYGK
jgi:TRAP-type C4-dicarboxylate transport system substrate-binding protein